MAIRIILILLCLSLVGCSSFRIEQDVDIFRSIDNECVVKTFLYGIFGNIDFSVCEFVPCDKVCEEKIRQYNLALEAKQKVLRNLEEYKNNHKLFKQNKCK